MKISLHGSYFVNNYGDILLMKIFSQWIREYDSSIEISYPLLRSGVIIDKPNNTSNGVFNLLRSNALVFFGGGYFGEPPVRKKRWCIRNFFRHIIIALIAVVFRIPYAIIGVEFGPLSIPWFRRFVIFIAKKADCLVVRNQESLDFLLSYGVSNAKLSCDAVLSLSDSVKPREVCSNKILLHIARTGVNVNVLLNCLIKVFKEKQVSKVAFIEDEVGQLSMLQSSGCFDLFEKACISYELLNYEGTDKIVDAINSSEMIITTKLHIGISGIALNKKVFSVYIHPKTLRLHKQVGNEYNCIALNDINSSVESNINQFIDAEPFLMPNDVLEMARNNKTALFSFLDNLKQ